MAYAPLTKIPQQFFDNLGDPLVGGTLYAYLAGTSTPTNLFSDNAGTVAGTSVVLDSRGEPTTFKMIWLDTTKIYKLVLKDSNGTTVWTVDNVSGDDGTGAGSASTVFDQQTLTATAGQTLFNLGFTYVTGTNAMAVYKNGARLITSVDFSETSSTSVTLTQAAIAGDEYTFIGGQDVSSSFSSSNVSYSQGGTGAVVRSVQTKLRESVSVLDFGAVGDGVTDDLPALEAAIAYLDSVGGGTLFFPSGTYLIIPASDQAWGIAADNIHIKGEGDSSVLYVSADRKIISVSNASNFRIDNIKFEQVQTGTNRQTMLGLTNVENAWIKDCLFENGTATPVVLNSGNTDIFICNNRFLNYYENGVDIIGSNNSRITISNNICTTNTYNPNPGVSRPMGIVCEPQTSGVNSDILVSGNTVDLTGLSSSSIRNATYGIRFGDAAVPATPYLLKRVVISDNIVRGVGWGIDVVETRRGATDGGFSGVIANNLIEQCGHEGIRVYGGPDTAHYDNVIISNNLIRGVSEQSTGVDDGIQLDQYLQGPAILSNKVERRVNETGAAGARYGIYLGANVSNALIDGNMLTEALSGRIKDDNGTASIGRTGKSQSFYTSVSTITGNETITPETGTVLIRTPSGASRNISPSTSAAELWPKGHTIFIVNAATSNFNLVFDPSGINVSISRQSSAAFTYNGTAWVQLRYSASNVMQEDSAANIASAAATINTADKYIGKLVWDNTNNRLMRASNSTTTAAWWVVDGSTSVTPA